MSLCPYAMESYESVLGSLSDRLIETCYCISVVAFKLYNLGERKTFKLRREVKEDRSLPRYVSSASFKLLGG